MQITRSIGDFFSPQTISEPHVTRIDLRPDTLFSQNHYEFDCQEKARLRKEKELSNQNSTSQSANQSLSDNQMLSSYLEYSLPPPLWMVMASDGVCKLIFFHFFIVIIILFIVTPSYGMLLIQLHAMN